MKNQNELKSMITNLALSKTEQESIKGGTTNSCNTSCVQCVTRGDNGCISCVGCVTKSFDKSYNVTYTNNLTYTSNL